MNKSDAEQIVRQLSGQWYGQYGMVRCVAHEDRNPSLKISNGDHSIVLHCFAGCDWKTVQAQLVQLGLLDKSYGSAKVAKVAKAARMNKVNKALSIWRTCQPISNTLAEAYLIARRLEYTAFDCLRYHPRLRHGPTFSHHPCLVACVKDALTDKFLGIHRIYLSGDGRNKAQIEKPKLSLGQVSGGGVFIGIPTSQIVVGEGIETVLSLANDQDFFGCAGLSAHNLPKLNLPTLPIAQQVLIAADNDKSQVGLRAAKFAAQRWEREGRAVRLAVPPIGLDFNDLLRGLGNG